MGRNTDYQGIVMHSSGEDTELPRPTITVKDPRGLELTFTKDAIVVAYANNDQGVVTCGAASTKALVNLIPAFIDSVGVMLDNIHDKEAVDHLIEVYSVVITESLTNLMERHSKYNSIVGGI